VRRGAGSGGPAPPPKGPGATVPAADLGSRPDLVKRDPRRQQAWE